MGRDMILDMTMKKGRCQLQIELPNGVLHFSLAYSFIPTMAGKHSSEPDLSQLSEQGKRFMAEIPDLSYMLKSTLSLAKA